ncbi:MAG: hypothetical protein A4E48_00487 [Methanosaeta sp. PtaU1.Bin060]|nr:MAG: hypothetical protein A4E48_00487 [Methanosaeta sp. PtaU1.Bin060]
MDNKNEILFAVREVRRNLKDTEDFRVADILAVFEGIAPFLDKGTVISIKCKGCDNYAQSFFPLKHDFVAVDKSEYCHAKEASLKNISALKLAGCPEYSSSSQEELFALANTILEEDLRPAFAERKLYDRSKFASYSVSFCLEKSNGNVCIEFGRMTKEGFLGGDIKLYLVRRLDPGFGAASQKIADAIKSGPVMVVDASLQTRRPLDIDYVLEWIAKKRKMDIVYL